MRSSCLLRRPSSFSIPKGGSQKTERVKSPRNQDCGSRVRFKFSAVVLPIRDIGVIRGDKVFALIAVCDWVADTVVGSLLCEARSNEETPNEGGGAERDLILVLLLSSLWLLYRLFVIWIWRALGGGDRESMFDLGGERDWSSDVRVLSGSWSSCSFSIRWPGWTR